MLAGGIPLGASVGGIAVGTVVETVLVLVTAGFVLVQVFRFLRTVVASFRFRRLPEPPVPEPEPEPPQSPDNLDHLFLARLITAEEYERLREKRTAGDVTNSPES
jgi:hypothetical protein